MFSFLFSYSRLSFRSLSSYGLVDHPSLSFSMDNWMTLQMTPDLVLDSSKEDHSSFPIKSRSSVLKTSILTQTLYQWHRFYTSDTLHSSSHPISSSNIDQEGIPPPVHRQHISSMDLTDIPSLLSPVSRSLTQSPLTRTKTIFFQAKYKSYLRLRCILIFLNDLNKNFLTRSQCKQTLPP